MMRSGAHFPALAAALIAAAAPASAADQVTTAASASIEAPAGINVTGDVPTQLLLSQSSITFVEGQRTGTGSLGLAGFVAQDAKPVELLARFTGGYSLTGTTLSQDVLSVSVASGLAEPKSADSDISDIDVLRVVLAQYN
jgi:hypothetical protein